MMHVLQNFVGDPIRHRRFDLAWYRISQLLHDRTNGAFDYAYMRVARLLWGTIALPASPQMDAAAIADVVGRLRSDGYMILPYRLSAEEIDAITTFAFSTPAHGVDMGKSISASPSNIPKGEPRLSWWMHDLARVPAIQRLVADGPYCAIAQEYLRCRPTLAHITLFLDAPYEGTYEPYRYHCDNEGPGFLKFFFFLTDVEIGTGAHYFIAGTHAHAKPHRFARMAFYDHDDLLDQFGRGKEVVIRGPAGTILAEDTAGFHRGSTIERNYRLMMQFEFSAIEVPTEQELARELEPVAVPGIHPNIAGIARKYFAVAEK